MHLDTNETRDLNKYNWGRSQWLSMNTCSEIADNFESFKNFLIDTCWVPEKHIPAIEYIISEKDSFIKSEICNLMPELYVRLKNFNIDDNTIYSFLWPVLIENYAWIVDNEEAVLSAYLIKSITC